MKVSFDFDDTLNRPEVEQYAKELVERGLEVWIVTTRYDQRAEIMNPQYFKLHAPQSWEEVFETADRIGIKREHIVFTCYDWKASYFRKNKDFAFHLDDNYQEQYDLPVPFVLREQNGKWKDTCDLMINLESEQ